jgi:Fe(3+) dicitrate transport protein
MLLLPALTLSPLLAADAETSSREVISIMGSRQQLETLPGSGYRLSEDDLAAFKFTDLNQILKQIPGVTIQEEDGYGLRPNIGLRGVQPHRSRKVVFFEDSVLAGPAPYSAPAAYYVPIPTRLHAVEVYKGPASIAYGPNTVGGAINLITRPLAKGRRVFAEVARGQFGYRKGLLGYYDQAERWSWGLEAASFGADGFKELPTGGSTGFQKDDLLVKLGYDLSAAQRLELKLGWSREFSNETYLGLTRDDFANDPYQRYLASDLDRMDWYHRQWQLSHFWDGVDWSLATRLYRHEFARNWGKFSGFSGDVSVRDVLLNPTGVNQHFLDVLRGTDDSLGDNDELVIGHNHRWYRSEGIQWDGSWNLAQAEGWGLDLAFGLRLHQDWIRRDHTEETRGVFFGTISERTEPFTGTTQNRDESEALAAYVQSTLVWQDWELTAGVRQEQVKTQRTLLPSGEVTTENSDRIWIPGMAVLYHVSSAWKAFAGLHKGFTLVGPGQVDRIEPEESWNFELGTRWRQPGQRLDLVGFFNDYRNIKGVCSFSSGCDPADLDREYNGGRAEIWGAELSLFQRFIIAESLALEETLSYTYTSAQFAEATTSDNVEWGLGDIQVGDPLPYLPEHDLSLKSSLQMRSWLIEVLGKWVAQRYDQSVADGRESLPSYQLWDVALRYLPSAKWEAYLNVQNALDDTHVVSLRPYGARPGKPRTIVAGIKWGL